jgi:hypothetical protein
LSCKDNFNSCAFTANVWLLSGAGRLIFLGIVADANLKAGVRQRLNNAFGHLLGFFRIEILFRMLFEALANCRRND